MATHYIYTKAFEINYFAAESMPSSNCMPTIHEESSIMDPIPQPLAMPQAQPVVTFEIVDEGSKRRKPKIVDSLGFSYNVLSRRKYATYWQCTVRGKKNPCKASIIERDSTFTPGRAEHNHAAEIATATTAKIIAAVKKKAVNEKFMPANLIVNEVKYYYNIYYYNVN